MHLRLCVVGKLKSYISVAWRMIEYLVAIFLVYICQILVVACLYLIGVRYGSLAHREKADTTVHLRKKILSESSFSFFVQDVFKDSGVGYVFRCI